MNSIDTPVSGSTAENVCSANLRSAATGRHSLHVRVADNFFQRLRGLMFSQTLPSQQGLLLMRCASVHTAFMRYPIDVLYLDGTGRVLKCVPNLRPWRTSASGLNWLAARRLGAVHTLELAAGSIDRLQLKEGDHLDHPRLAAKQEKQKLARRRQRGAAMTEFVVVGPAITIMGLATVQYGMLYNAKNMVNHASFMAARAGSFSNAKFDSIQQAYLRALLPLYGGGRTETKRAESASNVANDLLNPEHPRLRIELLNPTKESFDDWSDPKLQADLKLKKRVIPNGNLAYKLADAATAKRLGTDNTYKDFNGELVKKNSGQSLTDANLLKLRITHGYKPSVPLMGLIYTKFLKWSDPKDDPVRTAMIEDGRIPIVSNVTVQMQSDAYEPDSPVSIPGEGNHGAPKDPGEPPGPTEPPPKCATMGCTVEDPSPSDPGGGGSPGPKKPDCPEDVKQVLSADALFQFGKSSLADMLPGGTAKLDELIAYAKSAKPTSVTIVGYTDQLGPLALNQKLSEDRAKTVRDYLKAHGFPDIPIEIIGKGPASPIVPLSACSSKPTIEEERACLQPNRRVEVTLHGITK